MEGSRSSLRLKGKARVSYVMDSEDDEEPFQTAAVVVPGASESTHSSIQLPVETMRHESISVVFPSSNALVSKRQSHSTSRSSNKKTRRVSEDQTEELCAQTQPSSIRRVSDPIDENEEKFLFCALGGWCNRATTKNIKMKRKTIQMPNQGVSKSLESKMNIPDLENKPIQDIRNAICMKFDKGGSLSDCTSRKQTSRKQKSMLACPTITVSEEETIGNTFASYVNSELGFNLEEVQSQFPVFPDVVKTCKFDVVAIHPRASNPAAVAVAESSTTGYQIVISPQRGSEIQENTKHLKFVFRKFNVFADSAENLIWVQYYLNLFPSPYHHILESMKWFVKHFEITSFTADQLWEHLNTARKLGYLAKRDEACSKFLQGRPLSTLGGTTLEYNVSLAIARSIKANWDNYLSKDGWENVENHPANRTLLDGGHTLNRTDKTFNIVISNSPHLRNELYPFKEKLFQVTKGWRCRGYPVEKIENVVHGFEQLVDMAKKMNS